MPRSRVSSGRPLPWYLRRVNLDVKALVDVVDTLATAGVLGLMLRWALKRLEEKDKQIADLADRFSQVLEQAIGDRDER